MRTRALRIEAYGICDSDYEQYDGVLRTPMPVVPDEPLGQIAKIGDGAKRWVSTSATVLPSKRCCRAGIVDRACPAAITCAFAPHLPYIRCLNRRGCGCIRA
jgi:threonine dehydrogenase-like Zn-dependent dehydrogenase